MAKLYTDASGALLRCDVTPGQLQQSAPASTVNTLDFDPQSNGVLVVNVVLQPARVTYDGTTTRIGGNTYTVQAATTDYQQQQAAISNAQQARDAITTYLALATPTNAQNVTELQLLSKIVRYLLHEAVSN